MTESTCPTTHTVGPAPNQQDFCRHVMPRVESSAAWRFKQLPACEQEEAIANSVALAWSLYRQLVLRGKEPLNFCTRIASIAVCRVCEGRQVGNPTNSTDVLSRATRQQHGITVESVDARRYEPKAGWRLIVVEDHRAGPADTAAARLDIADWLSRMPLRRRRIAESLAVGNSPMDVACEFNLSRGRISQLRVAFRKSWAKFQGE